MTYTNINGVQMDNVLAQSIPRIRHDVLKRDRDKVLVVDGREGTGKSVFAMQLAKSLDADFSADKIFFNHETFIKGLKDPNRKKGDCILLDEAFSSASSRASMSSINRAMITVATEMRQLNLFVIIVLPSFFDLDKYFAIWRCETLFHVYFNKQGKRGQYIIFPFNKKKYLYINGKKHYTYGCVKSPYPPCQFTKTYVVDEAEYRAKKARAFRKREISDNMKKVKDRFVILLNYLKTRHQTTDKEMGEVLGIDSDTVQKYRTGKR